MKLPAHSAGDLYKSASVDGGKLGRGGEVLHTYQLEMEEVGHVPSIVTRCLVIMAKRKRN